MAGDNLRIEKKENVDYNMKKSETNTENIFREFYGTKTFIEKNSISEKYEFKTKKNITKNHKEELLENKGYPDFFKDMGDFLIIVEAKDSISKQEQAELETKYYMSNVSNKYNSIGIAISGQNEKELKVSTYIQIKGSKKVIDLNIKQLLSLEELKNIYVDSSSKINYESLISYSDKLNTIFHEEFKITVHKRPFFFAALLFSFDSLNEFINNYKTETFIIYNENTKKEEKINFNDNLLSDRKKVDYINSIIHKEVIKKFDKKITNSFKITIPSKFQFITTDNSNISSENYIKFLKEFTNIFSSYKQTVKYYDVIGTFYSEFLRYVQKAGGQDIVLTPDHIKTFMCELVDLQEDSVVLDICVGSGGFSAVSYGMIDRKTRENGNASYQKLENIKEKQIIGVEIDEDMYSLAFSNMILHGDGKSNLYKGNSLTNFEVEQIENENGEFTSITFEDKIKELQPNVSLMNPPYNDDAAPEFILRLCELLKKAGNGSRISCIIAPSSCLRKKIEITKSIFEIAKLKTIIDMNTGLFVSQNINVKTSIFIFEVGKKHSGKTYFYDMKEDGFKYSKRKMENLGNWEDNKNNALKDIESKKEINNKSYNEEINLETFENTIYTPKQEFKISNLDFIKSLIDYSIFELQESLNEK